MTTHRLRTSITVALFFFGCLLPSAVSAQMPQFDSLYVFGDSLADNGNLFIQSRMSGDDIPVPPSISPHRTYFKGRFSNGYIGFEHLWQLLSGRQPGTAQALQPFLASPFLRSTGAVNFAFGGTGTPYLDQTPGGMWTFGLKGQVELFRLALLGRRPSNRALYAITTGPNDYRADPFNVPMDPTLVVRNIEDSIAALYRLGARHVMVLDLPDLGLIPANGGDPNATLISIIHNDLLAGAVARLRARYPDLHVVPVTLNPLFLDLLSQLEGQLPALEAVMPLYPGMSACLFLDPTTCQDVPNSAFNVNLGFLFWDVVHPTTEAHRYLGEYMLDVLAESYQE